MSDATLRSGVRATLLTFTRRGANGLGRVWRYAASDVPVVAAGLTYAPAALAHEPVRQGSGAAKAALRVEVAPDTPVLVDWRAEGGLRGAPDAPTHAVVMAVTLDAAGAVTSTEALFSGRVSEVSRESDVAVLLLEPLDAMLAREVPRAQLQRQCTHALYDARCGVDPSAVAWPATVTARGAGALGPTVTLTFDGVEPPGFGTDDGTWDATYFDGGLLDVTDDDGRTVRLYVQQGDGLALWPTVTLALLRAAPAGAVGAAATAYPGCVRTIGICRSRFANARRFGGFPDLPDRDLMIEGVGFGG